MVLSMERWRGKVAVVTGASAGIGSAIAEALVKEGLQVVGLARRKERIEQLSETLADQPGQLHAFRADISKEEDILAAFKWIRDTLGPVSILINNAGLAEQTSLSDGETEKWRRVLETNVNGLSVATREALRSMRDNGIDGHVVHINSTAGHRVPPYLSNINVYPASKYAVTALTETLRLELNSMGSKIKISSVSPGPTDTDMLAQVSQGSAKQTSAFPVKLKSEDIADGVVYVLSTPPHVQVHELIIRPIGHKA